MALLTFVLSMMINQVLKLKRGSGEGKTKKVIDFSVGIRTFILAINSILGIFRYFLVTLASPCSVRKTQMEFCTCSISLYVSEAAYALHHG